MMEDDQGDARYCFDCEVRVAGDEEPLCPTCLRHREGCLLPVAYPAHPEDEDQGETYCHGAGPTGVGYGRVGLVPVALRGDERVPATWI